MYDHRRPDGRRRPGSSNVRLLDRSSLFLSIVRWARTFPCRSGSPPIRRSTTRQRTQKSPLTATSFSPLPVSLSSSYLASSRSCLLSGRRSSRRARNGSRRPITRFLSSSSSGSAFATRSTVSWSFLRRRRSERAPYSKPYWEIS